MTEWFKEKPFNVSVTEMKAFGIEISIRHGSAKELWEMLRFCENLARDGLEEFVKSCFYDGNSNCCVIELDYEKGDDAPGPAFMFKPRIIEVAEKHITQFDVDDYIGHGRFVSEF